MRVIDSTKTRKIVYNDTRWAQDGRVRFALNDDKPVVLSKDQALRLARHLLDGVQYNRRRA